MPRVSFCRFFILLSSLLESELEELDELEDPSESELDEVPLELLEEFDFFLFFFGAAVVAFFCWGGFFGVGFFFFLSDSLPEPELEEDPDSSFFTFLFKSTALLIFLFA